jgi:DnaJ-domain-containing protein 1
MQLPGRLRATTIGDLLGALHRNSASGTLELTEDRGRTHRVHFTSGCVTAVEIDGATPQLAELLKTSGALDDITLRRAVLRALTSKRLVGEVLASDFHVAPDVIDAALREQLVLRLRALATLEDARVGFRAALRQPREALRDQPLQPSEFLRGQRRARDRQAVTPNPPESSAYTLLGVERDADAAEIRRAFRRLARELHPDTHPHASDPERRALAIKFAQVAAAYQALVA